MLLTVNELKTLNNPKMGRSKVVAKKWSEEVFQPRLKKNEPVHRNCQ